MTALGGENVREEGEPSPADPHRGQAEIYESCFVAWPDTMIPERRHIHQSEAEVIRAALDRASVVSIDQAANSAIPNLEVVARCECGCASVDFDAATSEERSGIVADATGQTPRGGQVGIIVWGRSDAITALEIYAWALAMTPSFCRYRHP